MRICRGALLAVGAPLFLVFSSPCTQAKEPPPQVQVWPATGTPILQFAFGKLRALDWVGTQRIYTVDTEVKNLWTKPIGTATFTLYIYDKNGVRIGDGWMTFTNAAPGDVIKFQTNITVSGQPVSMKVEPRTLPPELGGFGPVRTISMTVNSVPQGAHFTLDGTEEGTTPKVIQVGAGTHLLEFDKEGYNHGRYPLAIAPNDVSGGSVSYELGTSAHDTIELRDGTVLSGDLQSVSATEVTVRIGGTDQSFSRNQVKRITLVQRDNGGQ